MEDTRAFAPVYKCYSTVTGSTQQGQLLAGTVVAASNGASVASTAFAGGISPAINNPQIQIANKTSVWVHVNFGRLDAGQTVRAAVITDYPVAPGAVVVVTVDPEVNACAVYADGAPSGSTSVVFTRGAGT